jgi:GTP pyrophosphokinase
LLNEKRLEREQYIQFVIDKLKTEWYASYSGGKLLDEETHLFDLSKNEK